MLGSVRVMSWWKIQFLVSLFILSTNSSLDINNIEIPDEKIDDNGNDNTGADYELVSGVAGHWTGLNCDISPRLSDDHLLLILWYKIGQQSPIYTFDVRDRPMSVARVYSDQTLFDEPTRAVMNVTLKPAALIISKLIPADSGLYKCRVDFKRSPTKHALWNLTVIVPPHPPTVYSSNGKRMSEVLGPYKLGSALEATCVNSGGLPAPRLSWWRDGIMIDDTYEEVNGQTLNALRLENITRADQGTRVTCQADNNNVSSPAVTTLQLMVAYPASKVILSGPVSMMAGDVASFTCDSHNVSGHSNFRWFIGNTELHDHTDTQEAGDRHRSTLRYSPSWEDDGLYLSCSSYNIDYPNITRDDGYILDIKCRKIEKVCYISGSNIDIAVTPRAKIRFWRNLVWTSIHLGDDVYLECDVEANPSVYNVTWRHNGKRIEENVSGGILVHNHTLVLQSVSLDSAGLYTCVASNTVADGESNALHLDIKYAPQCVHSRPVVVWASLGSLQTIYCKSRANPPPTKYRWKFQSSVASQPSGRRNQDKILDNKSKFEDDKLESVLEYSVDKDEDFGRITCWAENSAEGENLPCTFIVTPSIRPGILNGCKMLNKTWDSLQMACRMSETSVPVTPDTLTYVATVLDRSTNLSWSINFTKPEFNISQLAPATHYSIQLYAANTIGAGPAITLLADTYSLAEKRTAESKIALQTVISENDSDMMMIMMGVMLAVIIVSGCMVSSMIIIMRQRQRGAHGTGDNSSLGSGQSSHLGADVDTLVRSCESGSNNSGNNMANHHRSSRESVLFTGHQYQTGSIDRQSISISSRQTLVGSKGSSHSLDRRQSVGTGVMTTFSRDPRVSHVTLPRGRHVKDKIKSEECLMLSCQVLHPDSEVFPHMLEPPNTFKDNCGDIADDNEAEKVGVQESNAARSSTHL